MHEQVIFRRLRVPACPTGTVWSQTSGACEVEAETCGAGTAWDEVSSTCEVVCADDATHGRMLQEACHETCSSFGQPAPK